MAESDWLFKMIAKLTCIVAIVMFAAACSRQTSQDASDGGVKIVSLDFCADQFVLKLADRENILALSPDAEAVFSYMREDARGVAKVRPRAEDILLLAPDIVVRTYGGGPNATAFFERAGIKVVQIAYAGDLDTVKQGILDAAEELGAAERGAALVTQMDMRLAALAPLNTGATILYMTSKGAVAGRGTLVGELLERAGYENFQAAPGWSSLPLERLAYESPDVIAAGFFDTSDMVSDMWTPSRHPVARRQLSGRPVIDLPSAWTACSGWFLLDALEALAAAPTTGSSVQ
jgi:iron complex transport system substrate-binding protein